MPGNVEGAGAIPNFVVRPLSPPNIIPTYHMTVTRDGRCSIHALAGRDGDVRGKGAVRGDPAGRGAIHRVGREGDQRARYQVAMRPLASPSPSPPLSVPLMRRVAGIGHAVVSAATAPCAFRRCRAAARAARAAPAPSPNAAPNSSAAGGRHDPPPKPANRFFFSFLYEKFLFSSSRNASDVGA